MINACFKRGSGLYFAKLIQTVRLQGKRLQP
jgi:hypothetical protein